MKTQVKTLLLLLNVCIVIVTYAISPIDFSFGSNTLKKVDLSASLAGGNGSVPQDTIPQDTVIIKKKEKDMSKQRFLFVGDSMTEPLAHYFWNYANENGHQLYTVSWYGSSSYSWGGTKTLEHFMEIAQPTFIVLCMGSNELTLKDMNTVTRNVNKVLEKVQNVPFVWVGPPSYTANNPNAIKRWIDKGYNDKLIELIGADRYFDSRDLQMDRARDGLHPTMKGASIWMDQLAKWMESEWTRHPVMMNAPTQKSAIQNLTVMQTKDKGFY